MTDKLVESTNVPNWILVLFVGAFLSIFATGWIKVDNLSKELTVEQTSRCYIEQMLERIDKKVDKIDARLSKLED